MPPPARRGNGSDSGSPDDIVVQGAEQFADLAARLRAAGRTDLLKELQKGLREAVKPLTPASRAEARRRLPQRGGLADRVARAPQRQTARSGRTTTSIRVTVNNKRSGAAGADRGRVRHPVYGNRNAWVEQQVRPGWFTDTATAERDAMQQAVLTVLREFTERLARPL